LIAPTAETKEPSLFTGGYKKSISCEIGGKEDAKDIEDTRKIRAVLCRASGLQLAFNAAS
jgi:hypothetical protein